MHLHFSPFQHATSVEYSDYDVSTKKVVQTLKKLTKSDKTHDMGSTMSCHEAAMIPGSPNAFISPNAVGVMKDLKMPVAPTGVAKPTLRTSHSGYDHAHRSKGREHYNDRAVVKTLGDAIVV
jgi:hypothetical protein